jgi:hypothetical protein
VEGILSFCKDLGVEPADVVMVSIMHEGCSCRGEACLCCRGQALVNPATTL